MNGVAGWRKNGEGDDIKVGLRKKEKQGKNEWGDEGVNGSERGVAEWGKMKKAERERTGETTWLA